MLDGALTIGSEELDDVTWLTPAQVFAIRLAEEIRSKLEPVTMNRVRQNLKNGTPAASPGLFE